MSAHRALTDMFAAPFLIEDPGDAKTITIDRWGAVVPMVSAAAETRTLAQPTKAGLSCTLQLDTYVGAITVTVTGGYDLAGNTVLVFGAAGHWANLISVKVGTSYFWKIVAWEGVTGSTRMTDLLKITGITNGWVAANKALVADSLNAINVVTAIKLLLNRRTVAAHTSLQSTCTASLSYGLNVVSAGATDSGGVKLPAALAGGVVALKNDAASTVWVFTDGVENCSINALNSSTGFPVGATKSTILIGDTASRWITFPLAVA